MHINMRSSERQLPSFRSEELAVLRPPVRISGNRLVVGAGEETLYSNEEMVRRRQVFPGQELPSQTGRLSWPVPDKVGYYCTEEEFKSRPKFMAQWVHWPDRAKMVIEGRYHDLPPVHFEGIFTLVCNFACPHCSRRVTRTRWVEGSTWGNNVEVEKKNTMHPEGLKRVIDQIATHMTDNQMGIIWGGGDPTASPFTYDAMRYARSRGISSSFLTNGVFLDVSKVLETEPILVRISLNCGTEEAYRRFHGYPANWDYFDRVKRNLRDLAATRQKLGSSTLVGVSLIVDERNLEDLVEAAKEIRAVVNDVGPGIDYVIVRPVFDYAHFTGDWVRLGKDTKRKAWDLIAAEGAVSQIIEDELGIPLIPIKDSFEEAPSGDDYISGECLAYGIAGEIRHNGDVQLCSDSYGNPEYTIGNLFDQTLDEVWRSTKRKEVLSLINEKACFKRCCPHNSRGHHYNRLFHQVEQMRKAGRMDEVTRWIDDLRETTFSLGHSFFL